MALPGRYAMQCNASHVPSLKPKDQRPLVLPSLHLFSPSLFHTRVYVLAHSLHHHSSVPIASPHAISMRSLKVYDKIPPLWEMESTLGSRPVSTASGHGGAHCCCCFYYSHPRESVRASRHVLTRLCLRPSSRFVSICFNPSAVEKETRS